MSREIAAAQIQGRPCKLRSPRRAEVSSLEKQLDGKNKQLDTEKKRFDDLVRERDILTKLKSQAENSSTKQLDLIKINEGTKRNLEQEVQVRAAGSLLPARCYPLVLFL